MHRTFFVYILASAPFGAIYIGVTSDIVARIEENREGRGSTHVAKYKIFRLVHLEEFSNAPDAILREKRLKRWRRSWKDALIERDNPGWHDLYNSVRGDPLLP